MDNIVVITIIAVFWLSGLLMTWSMCIVAARADRRMEERGRGCRPDDTSRSLGGTPPATGKRGDASPPVSPS